MRPAREGSAPTRRPAGWGSFSPLSRLRRARNAGRTRTPPPPGWPPHERSASALPQRGVELLERPDVATVLAEDDDVRALGIGLVRQIGALAGPDQRREAGALHRLHDLP